MLLHGNPAVDVFNGLKLAAGGELGMGVGEEEWGSGEREVLEGFIDRTEGLVDLVVSRFGETPQVADSGSMASRPSGIGQSMSGHINEMWLGSRNLPTPQDGVIFSGGGSITRTSLKSISSWLEWLYRDGDDTYGVRDNPNSAQRRKRKHDIKSIRQSLDYNGSKLEPALGTDRSERGRTPDHRRGAALLGDYPNGIPPPIITATDSSLAKATAAADPSRRSRSRSQSKTATLNDPAFGTENVMKYLTLGLYGSSWGFSSKKNPLSRRTMDPREDDGTADKVDTESSENAQTLDEGPPMQDVDPEPEVNVAEDDFVAQNFEKSIGRFVIGLQGDLENEASADDEVDVTDPGTDRDIRSEDWNRRIMLRTLHVERVKARSSRARSDTIDSNGMHCPFEVESFLMISLHSRRPKTIFAKLL